MKKLRFLPLLFLLSATVAAQDYPPLLIDSFHRYSVNRVFDTTFTSETYRAYDYDADNRLIEARYQESRFRYEYSGDTIFTYSELLQEDGSFIPNWQNTFVFDGELQLSSLSKRYINGSYVNHDRYFYQYNSEGMMTLVLKEHWEEGEWANHFRQERTYDEDGNKTEEAAYRPDENGVFEYRQGRLFQYNGDGLLTEEIEVQTDTSGPYYSSRSNYTYDSEGRQESDRHCRYEGPDSDCVNVWWITYQYFGQDSIKTSALSWESDQWQQSGIEWSYPGPGVYSNLPDSLVFYDYLPDTDTFQARMREYFQYQELEDDKVYFRAEKYRYYPQIADWELAVRTEEWYTLPVPLSGNEQEWQPTLSLSLFPNPCRPGQQLSLKNLQAGNTEAEVFIFDMQGRLCVRMPLSGNATLRAPAQKGTYTVLIRSEGKILGTFRQVVQ